MADEVPAEPTEAEITAGVACLHASIDELRATQLATADRELVRRILIAAASAGRDHQVAEERKQVQISEKAGTLLTELREHCLTVSAGELVEGAERYRVEGPQGGAWFFPAQGAGAWRLVDEPAIGGAGVASLILRLGGRIPVDPAKGNEPA